MRADSPTHCSAQSPQVRWGHRQQGQEGKHREMAQCSYQGRKDRHRQTGTQGFLFTVGQATKKKIQPETSRPWGQRQCWVGQESRRVLLEGVCPAGDGREVPQSPLPWHFWEQLPVPPCPCLCCLERSLPGAFSVLKSPP